MCEDHSPVPDVFVVFELIDGVRSYVGCFRNMQRAQDYVYGSRQGLVDLNDKFYDEEYGSYHKAYHDTELVALIIPNVLM